MLSKESGIYFIVCLINQKKYIGGSGWLKRRKVDHFSLLRNNRHWNKNLQGDWNKYGEENFEFKIIEYCCKENIPDKEKSYILAYKTINVSYGYNKILNTGTHSLSEEAREKIRNQKIGSKHSAETIRKMKEIHKEVWHTPEAREKIRRANLGKKHQPREKNNNKRKYLERYSVKGLKRMKLRERIKTIKRRLIKMDLKHHRILLYN